MTVRHPGDSVTISPEQCEVLLDATVLLGVCAEWITLHCPKATMPPEHDDDHPPPLLTIYVNLMAQFRATGCHALFPEDDQEDTHEPS